jgi:putative hydrolase of the HAD superfamily
VANNVTAIFYDVGGVLLSNGWDTKSRRAVVDHCGLDWEEFEDRHQLVAGDFELGKLSLDQYLERTVFYRDRDFERNLFWSVMKEQSKPIAESLALLDELAATGEYLLATLNNESRELNEHRIDTFGLRDRFSLFLSSCYLGLKKPEPEIFQAALDVSQRLPEECLFIDDRPLNLECAVRARMRTIQYVDADQLRASLRAHGVAV